MRLTAMLSAAVAVASLMLAVPTQAAAPVPRVSGIDVTVPLQTQPSVRYDVVEPIGETKTYGVIYNSPGTDTFYRVHPDGTALAKLGTGRARAIAAGELFYSDFGSPVRYLDLTNGATGLVPHGWYAPAPHGGVQITREPDGWHATLTTNSGVSTPLGKLPDVPNEDNVFFDVISSDDGFSVIAELTSEGDRLVIEYNSDFTAGNYVPLDNNGVDGADGAFCGSMTAAALGCQIRDSVVRVSTDPAVPPQITDANGEIISIAATADFTAFTIYEGPSLPDDSQTCPCGFYTVPVGDTAPSAARHKLPGPAMAAGGDGNFFYTGSEPPGLLRARSATAVQELVATALHSDARIDAIALGPGSAVWTDDSVPAHATFSRTIRSRGADVALGRRAEIATGAASELSTSGSRIAYVAAHRSIRVHTKTGSKTVGRGWRLTLSGMRVLYRESASGSHWMIYNLVTGNTQDYTQRLGASPDAPAALWGDYLAYFASDGSLWRAQLSGHHGKVRLAPPNKYVYAYDGLEMWGDWVAFHAGKFIRVRNARTLAPADDLIRAGEVMSASAAGVLVLTNHTWRYRLESWRDGSLITVVPDSPYSDPDEDPAPAADGSLIAYQSVTGRAMVERLSGHVANRPRSLGDPVAPVSINHAKSWRFDLVSSAPLRTCAVRIWRHSHVVHTLRCNRHEMSLGEARARWRAPVRGTYRWQLVAGNADGTMLPSNGAHRAPRGVITVH